MVQDLARRRFIILGVFIAASVILIGRAMQLQLIDSNYRFKAAAMTIERAVSFPSRGVIYDRNNNLMVYNNPMYDILATYNQIDFLKDTNKIQRLCRLLSIDTATFHTNLEKNWKSGQFNKSIPYTFLSLITPEQYARFQESLHEFTGFSVQLRNVRGYPQHNGGSVLGYLSEVNPTQLKDSSVLYEAGDYIGASGIEKYYESFLRGSKGVQFIMKDNMGRLVGPWKEGKLDTAAIQGKDLICTVDLNLQSLGEKLLANKIGAIVAIEPQTGEILASVTAPTFDPNKMVISKGRSAIIAAMLKDSLKPFFDRTVTAEYPPGSIFKPMMGLIALNMGVWDKNNGVACNGGYFYNGRRLTKCHIHSYSGDLSEGIMNSCNGYFCTVYRAMIDRYSFKEARRGLDSLNEAIYKFGMGKRLGVDFPAERGGNVPTSRYYNRIYTRDKYWYSTNIVSNGIGQGENNLTTIQMANLAATIANRGWFYTPHLIRGAKLPEGGTTPLLKRYTVKHFTGVAAENFDPVVRGMRLVVENGTGSNARINGIPVCGKTGTTQNSHGEDSSVFIGFAPQDDPKIAIAVYLENGGWGNDFAAPITGLMIEKFLSGVIAPNRSALIDFVSNSKLAYTPDRGYYVSKASR